MIKLVLDEIIAAVDGRCETPAPAVSVGGVSTDSRAIQRGELFFALSGERFEGHEFVPAALSGGAVAAVVARSRAGFVRAAARQAGHESALLIEVDEVGAALARLAAFHRRQLAAHVIAVVGSNGKTTTKAMIDHVLGGRMKGRGSPKSFNNAVGVPLTLLSAERGDEYLVVEIGTNAPGEVAALGRLARADMAVLTSIAEEHLEGLGDLRGVAEEEGSILPTLADGGFAAVHAAARPLLLEQHAAGHTIVTFGREADADVRITSLRAEHPWTHFEMNGRFAYRLGVAGPHNAVNAAGAITIARRLGFEHEEIADRLASFEPPAMRNESVRLGPVTVINDAYNANPASMIAAFDLLAQHPARGRRVAVIGEMRELGAHAARLHERVGRELARRGFDFVILVGGADERMRAAHDEIRKPQTRVETVADADAAGRLLAQELRDGDVVLLKASRAVGLERALSPLRKRFESLFAA